jgi:predicted MPP superfamily phosphohydrolase
MPRWVGALLFFGTALLIWGGLHAWFYFRLAGALDLGTRGRLALKIGLGVLAFAYLGARGLEAAAGHRAALALLWPGALWMGFLSIAICGLFVVEVAVALPAWILKTAGAVNPDAAHSAVRWAVLAALAAAVGLSGWGLTRALPPPLVSDHEVRLAGLPASLDGFRLAVASDIHAGELVTPQRLEGIASAIDAADADLVLLVGDLTDEQDGGDGTAFARLARVRSRHGVLASTGNHEFYSGGPSVLRTLEAAGIRVLRQGHAVVAGGLVVAAVDDPAFLEGGRGAVAAGIDRALDGRPPGLPVVLLSHQPLAVDHASRAGVGLMLCGHTHGGQIPPFQIVTGLAFDFLEGVHRVGDMTVFVSRGAGFWGPPMRVFADSEVVRITLRP